MEDVWEIQFDIVSGDWELISFPYDNLSTDADGMKVETNGNGVLEPHKLFSVTAFLIADPAAGVVTTYLDQIVFTTNGPYEP